jgi:hypothetical protein
MMTLISKSKFIGCILILSLVGLFVLKNTNNALWLAIDSVTPHLLRHNTINNDTISLANSANYTEANTRMQKSNGNIYRWKDKKGQWQFSDTPAAHIKTERMNITGQLNRDIAAKYISPKEKKAATTNPPTATTETGLAPSHLSPSKVLTLIEDSHHVQQLMDNRRAQLDKLSQ